MSTIRKIAFLIALLASLTTIAAFVQSISAKSRMPLTSMGRCDCGNPLAWHHMIGGDGEPIVADHFGVFHVPANYFNKPVSIYDPSGRSLVATVAELRPRFIAPRCHCPAKDQRLAVPVRQELNEDRGGEPAAEGVGPLLLVGLWRASAGDREFSLVVDDAGRFVVARTHRRGSRAIVTGSVTLVGRSVSLNSDGGGSSTGALLEPPVVLVLRDRHDGPLVYEKAGLTGQPKVAMSHALLPLPLRKSSLGFDTQFESLGSNERRETLSPLELEESLLPLSGSTRVGTTMQ